MVELAILLARDLVADHGAEAAHEPHEDGDGGEEARCQALRGEVGLFGRTYGRAARCRNLAAEDAVLRLPWGGRGSDIVGGGETAGWCAEAGGGGIRDGA